MTQDVTQWLEEIRTLRSQLAAVQQERDEAFAESVAWRDRLNAEMELRLRETQLLQQQIATLETAQRKQQELGEGTPAAPAPDSDIAADPHSRLAATLEQLTSLEDLRQFALEAALERDRLRQALTQERQAHQDTRENLSIALGDTIDLLTQRPSSGH